MSDGIVKAIPGAASVEVVSAAGARGAGRDIGFEPRWEKTPLKSVEGSVAACRLPNTPSSYHYCAVDSAGAGLVLKGSHHRGDPATHPIRTGSERYDLRMPDWMRPGSCSISVSAMSCGCMLVFEERSWIVICQKKL